MFGPPEPLPRPSKPKKPRKKKAKKDEDLESDKEEEEEEPEPEPEPSRRQNIFGHEDELVNAPKGESHYCVSFVSSAGITDGADPFRLSQRSSAH